MNSIQVQANDESESAEAEDHSTDAPSLPKLLASLALGVRSVNALPLTHDGDNSDGDVDGVEEDEDEFSFQMSLPEFASLNIDARQSLTSLLCQALEGLPSEDDDSGDGAKLFEFDDPELWERCADACDALYDRVAAFVNTEQSKQSGEGGFKSLSSALSSASQSARTNASGAHARMIHGLAAVEKPQSVYQGFVTQPPQNSRDEPFTPVISYDAEKQAAIDSGEFTKNGHGLDTRKFRVGDNDHGERDHASKKFPPDIIAPNHHYQHPFREDIDALEYRPWQLDVSGIQKADGPINTICEKNDNGVWIGTEEELARLTARILEGQKNGEIREIALDLEAHSHRSFAGFVCLIQLSLRRPKVLSGCEQPLSPLSIDTGHDFLIDALSLRHAIPAYLGPILTTPNLLKVMHGADSDVPWLQRDFGCYIVNLFDTGRASRALKFPSAGLAYLLRKYAGVNADKAHQLSDWRRRPLPEDMRTYAVSDTRYLLDIYDQLRIELEEHSSSHASIIAVLDSSKRVCLIRHETEAFCPSGYRSIMDGRNTRRNKNSKVMTELSPQQEDALKILYDWRDRTARQEDESVQYVCPNSALLRIASNRPTTVATLQRLVNPLPPLVMRRSQEILGAIRTSSKRPDSKGKSNANEIEDRKDASSMPAPPPPPMRTRKMLSPILGSEALYEKAGWTTPSNIVTSEVSESEDDDGVKNFLEVDAANKDYSSDYHSSHGLCMSPPSLENDSEASAEGAAKASQECSTDGMGTAHAALGKECTKSFQVAQRSANLIQKEMMKLSASGEAGEFGKGFRLIDLIRPFPPPEDADFYKDQETHSGSENIAHVSEAAPEEDEMTIPKSMREIYNLSNSNRRRTGKEKALSKFLHFPSGGEGVKKFKEDDFQEAEAVIASRGGPGGYFGGGNGKRLRLAPGKGAPGKEDDVKLMIRMGWVKDKKDAESLAIVPADMQTPAGGDGRGGPHHKKPGGSVKGGGGAGSSFDYYSNSGNGVGAFDPNAAPAKNPFFAGAATSASSLLHTESKGKSHKRNRKR